MRFFINVIIFWHEICIIPYGRPKGVRQDEGGPRGSGS